jgi:hypothetical protein
MGIDPILVPTVCELFTAILTSPAISIPSSQVLYVHVLSNLNSGILSNQKEGFTLGAVTIIDHILQAKCPIFGGELPDGVWSQVADGVLNALDGNLDGGVVQESLEAITEVVRRGKGQVEGW